MPIILFKDYVQTLDYIGSKKSLYDHLCLVCYKNIPDLKNKSFLDAFAGTGIVGFHMLNVVNKVIANDLEYYSFVINSALLKCPYTDKLETLIQKCNHVPGVSGLIHKNYTEESNRLFFTRENAKKCDGIRLFISSLLSSNEININEFNFLLASLLVSMDKVSNTSCVYGAFLKKFKKSSLKELVILPIHRKKNITEHNEVFNKRAEDLELNVDIMYLDPPYNQRQYSTNYFVLNYIAKYEDVDLRGKTGLIPNCNKSNFCIKKEVENAFEKLLTSIRSRYILLSYNNEGLLDTDTLLRLLEKKGKVMLYKIDYNKFKSNQNVDINKVQEYIWFIDTEG